MVRIISRYRLILPSSVSSLIKMFVMLEGTARLLSPAVNMLELIRSYQRKILRRRLSPRAQWQKWQRVLGEWRHIGETLPRGLDEVFKKIQSGTFDIHLEQQGAVGRGRVSRGRRPRLRAQCGSRLALAPQDLARIVMP